MRVRVCGKYPLLLAAIIQKLEWMHNNKTSEIFRLKNKEIKNEETLEHISESIQYFLAYNEYTRENVEKIFGIKIVYVKIRPDTEVSFLLTDVVIRHSYSVFNHNFVS